jgi:hypothetical protein
VDHLHGVAQQAHAIHDASIRMDAGLRSIFPELRQVATDRPCRIGLLQVDVGGPTLQIREERARRYRPHRLPLPRSSCRTRAFPVLES